MHQETMGGQNTNGRRLEHIRPLPEPSRKPLALAPLIFAAILLAFLLPFEYVVYPGEPGWLGCYAGDRSGDIAGIELVAGSGSQQNARRDLRGEQTNARIPFDFAAIGLGLGISAIAVRRRRLGLLRAGQAIAVVGTIYSVLLLLLFLLHAMEHMSWGCDTVEHPLYGLVVASLLWPGAWYIQTVLFRRQRAWEAEVEQQRVVQTIGEWDLPVFLVLVAAGIAIPFLVR